MILNFLTFIVMQEKTKRQNKIFETSNLRGSWAILIPEFVMKGLMSHGKG